MTTLDTPSAAVDAYIQHELEQWLYREAEILDSRDYEAWLELLSPNVRYYMPLQENRLDRDRARDRSRSEFVSSLFDDDFPFLRQRVARMNTGMAWNEEPPPRTRRFITNVMATVVSEGDEYVVKSNFFIKRNRLHDDQDEFAGCRRDTLARDETGQFRLWDRKIELDQSVILTKSFSLIF